MGQLKWERAVHAAIANRPELLPIFHDALGIAGHVRDYNPDLFIVLNVGRNLAKAAGLPRAEWPPLPPDAIPVWGAWWEIHSLTERPSYVMTVGYDALDCRILRDLYRSDVQVHGDQIIRDMEARNEHLKAGRKRAFGNELEAISLETRGLWAQVDGPRLHYGAGNPSTGHVFAPLRQQIISTPAGVQTIGR